MTPEPPFIEIPHHYTVPTHSFKQTLNLDSAFPGAQAQMSRNHLYCHSVTHKIEIDGTARLISGKAQIQQSDLAASAPRKDRVPVMAFALEQGGTRNHL